MSLGRALGGDEAGLGEAGGGEAAGPNGHLRARARPHATREVVPLDGDELCNPLFTLVRKGRVGREDWM